MDILIVDEVESDGLVKIDEISGAHPREKRVGGQNVWGGKTRITTN